MVNIYILKIILPDELSQVTTPIPGGAAKKFQTSKNEDHPSGLTCSMPWGVSSLNVDSRKTLYAEELLSIASDFPLYNVLHDDFPL